MKIRDRIKSLRRVKASELLPHPANWRTHPETQQDAMRGILAEIGWADAALVRETPDGLQLIDGHLRGDLAGDAFKREHDELKREHDELKREFYATRAYFDNTHDNMTDVWDFPRVKGDERHDHPTPKPVEMIGRIVKTSSELGDVVLDPFLGSGTTLIACENLSRRGVGIEISPAYVAVALQRMKDLGLEPQLAGGG